MISSFGRGFDSLQLHKKTLVVNELVEIKDPILKRGVFVLFNIPIFCDIYLFVNARVESVVV